MSDDFIAYTPGTSRLGPGEEPALFFVFCDQYNGRAPERNRPAARQHVMRRARRSARGKAQSGTAGDLRPHLGGRPRSGEKQSPRLSVVHPRQMLGDSIGPLLLPFETSPHIKGVLQWITAGQDPMQARRFEPAKRFYLQGLWHYACRQKLVLEGLAIIAYREKIQLAGNSVSGQSEYLLLKGNLIKAIRQQIAENEVPDSAALFAVAVLARCTAVDGEPHHSAIHLAGLRSMQALEKHGPAIFRIYLWILDLKVALFTNNLPILDRNGPKEMRRECGRFHFDPSARSDAIQLAWLSPTTADILDFSTAVDVYFKILQLCAIAEEESRTVKLPVYEVYEIEYDIRFLHTRVLQNPSGPVRTCVELNVLALQLGAWIASRYFSPLTKRTKSTVLRRAGGLLASLRPLELLDVWIVGLQADATSLLWVLALILSCCVAEFHQSSSLGSLAVVTDHLSISTEEEFLEKVQRWPPRHAWNSCWYSKLWARLVEFRHQFSDTSIDQRATSSGSRLASKPGLPSFGPFEFWDV